MTDQIIVRGARLHNLKNITVSIPKNRLVVLTGLSGSGKSTFGFDILHREGQRQYMESLGMVPYGLARPPVDSISGLSPTISIDQHLTNRSPRSTVGTSTDISAYLRVLFARLGHRPCPSCGKDIPPFLDPAQVDLEDGLEDETAGSEAGLPCPHCGQPVPQLTMAYFSFNKPEGACPVCTGLGTIRQADLTRLVDEQKSLLAGAVLGWNKLQIEYNLANLQAAAAHYSFEFDAALPVKDYSPAQRDLLFFGVESPQFREHFPTNEPPKTVRKGRFEGIAANLLRRHAGHIGEHVTESGYEDKLEEFLITQTCPACAGARLNPSSRSVTVADETIVGLSHLSLQDLDGWLYALPRHLGPQEQLLAAPILESLSGAIARLVEVGAGYLTTDRASVSLSTGESQRLRLASLLGSGLTGVLYVFDEPTIGLHSRDTRRLIEVLRRLRDLGNTVLVIEHDLEMISAADHLIDFGPGAGKNGGQVVAAGSPTEVGRTSASRTGAYLSGQASIPVPSRRRAASSGEVVIHGARQNNLQAITVRFPLGLFIAITGVSGSGKSTLVFDILDRAFRRRLYGSGEVPGLHDSIDGLELIDRVITIDQEHIGRIPRSNAATYSDAFAPIRQAFADSSEARDRHLSAKHFSFNVPGGRCERCQGAGVLTVEMQFLPPVEVRCPICHGRRFNSATLSVHYQGLDISQVLDMTVDEALNVFEDVPAAQSRLQVLSDVGLGYLQLGQPATTLSGGEAQRVKLAKELGRRSRGNTLYLLDEPTTGLHLEDTSRLLSVLHRLVDAGATVMVVEHNLEVVKTADWVIDLGPEGGSAGGRIVAQGTPEQLAAVATSYTGQGLKDLLLTSNKSTLNSDKKGWSSKQ